MQKRKYDTKWLCITALMGAIAAVLQFFEFAVPVMPSFIKFDFSDLPAMIAAFAAGPVSGAAVCLIKNLLHLPFGSSAGIGELANFLIGCGLVIPAGIIFDRDRTKRGAVIASLIGSIFMALISLPINMFITYPFYQNFMPLEAIIGAYQKINPNVNGLLMCLIVFNVPFTLIKGLCCSAITIAVYNYIAPLIRARVKPKTV